MRKKKKKKKKQKKKKKAAPQSTVYLRCDVYKVLKASLHATRFVGKIL